jgi:hypothetical protein
VQHRWILLSGMECRPCPPWPCCSLDNLWQDLFE